MSDEKKTSKIILKHFFKKDDSCEVRKIKPHEKINIRRKYLNIKANLGTAYQLYLNSVNNSPLTGFDEWLKQNYNISQLSAFT